MKILYIVNIYPDASNPAAEPFVRTQIDSVRKAGADVEIFNVRSNESKLNYGRALHAIRKLSRRKSYDVVHGHYVYSGWIAALAPDIKLSVVSYMGSDLLGSVTSNGSLSPHGRIDMMLSRILQSRVDGIIVKSNEMRNVLVAPEKAIVLPNGVDFDVFRPILRQECRRKLGLHADGAYILHIGRKNNPNKGYEIAYLAASQLSKESGCELLNVSGVAHDLMPIYMNAANVLVVPSRYEGSPNVVKEALACNLPVVATDVGDVRELIGNIPGCKIAERKPEAFSDAIRQLMTRTESFNGRKAIGHLRVEKIAAKLLDFYEQIIARGKS